MSFKNALSSGFGFDKQMKSNSNISRRVRTFNKNKSHILPQPISQNPNLQPDEAGYRGRVLVIDDDAFCRLQVSAPLTALGYKVFVAEDYGSSVSALVTKRFDFIVLDWMLADATGFDVLKQAEQLLLNMNSNLKTPIVTYSTCEVHQMHIPALTQFNYIEHWLKPFKLDQLKESIKQNKL